MDMKFTKVRGKLLLLLWSNVFKVLVAEDHDAALRYKQGEFVLLGIRELRQLGAVDLGANPRGEARQCYAGMVDEVRLGLVCFEAAVCEVERLCGWKDCRFIVHRQVVDVFVLLRSQLMSLEEVND